MNKIFKKQLIYVIKRVKFYHYKDVIYLINSIDNDYFIYREIKLNNCKIELYQTQTQIGRYYDILILKNNKKQFSCRISISESTNYDYIHIVKLFPDTLNGLSILYKGCKNKYFYKGLFLK